MPAINTSVLTLILATCNFLGILFAVYSYFRNPQIKTDQTTSSLEGNFKDLQRQVVELRETHLRAVENDLKLLTNAVNDLSKTVVRLSTIIDERIPKGVK